MSSRANGNQTLTSRGYDYCNGQAQTTPFSYDYVDAQYNT